MKSQQYNDIGRVVPWNMHTTLLCDHVHRLLQKTKIKIYCKHLSSEAQ